MASNNAAWLTEAKAYPFEVKSAPLGSPKEDQILIKNHAIAMNPIDGKLQSLAFYPLEYPTILGQDVAGEVVSVGPNVTGFKKGDRVIGNTAGFSTKQNTEKAFQEYTILEVNLTSSIPDSISYESGVVLPLAISTASAGLFNPDFLNLQIPTVKGAKSTGEVLLVWGGASAVGCAAIQLAVAAGYEVFTTASSKNFDMLKKLGAKQVFDYKDSSVVSDILGAIKGKTLAGVYDAVGGPAWAASMEIVAKAENVKNRFVATTIPRFPEPPQGVTIKQLQALSIRMNHVGKAVWHEYLPEALANGSFVPAPEPHVVGNGLDKIQEAVDVLNKGVSAQKVVVTL